MCGRHVAACAGGDTSARPQQRHAQRQQPCAHLQRSEGWKGGGGAWVSGGKVGGESPPDPLRGSFFACGPRRLVTLRAAPCPAPQARPPSACGFDSFDRFALEGGGKAVEGWDVTARLGSAVSADHARGAGLVVQAAAAACMATEDEGRRGLPDKAAGERLRPVRPPASSRRTRDGARQPTCRRVREKRRGWRAAHPRGIGGGARWGACMASLAEAALWLGRLAVARGAASDQASARWPSALCSNSPAHSSVAVTAVFDAECRSGGDGDGEGGRSEISAASTQGT
eukprot:362405-Chlamydomonas_euryale.AAC.4